MPYRRGGLLEKLGDMPWLLLMVTTLLLVAGLLMQYSAAGGHWDPYAKAHFARMAMGLGLCFTIALVPMVWLARGAYLLYFLGLALLLFVEVNGMMGGGAQRWIDLGFMTIQPSEFMKLGMIVALARYYHYLHPDDYHRPRFMVVPLLMIIIPAYLIYRQPNLGTTAILGAIAVCMLFAAGLSARIFWSGIVAILALIPIAWQFVLHDYHKQRVMTFLDPSADPLGAGYNISQSMIAVGSGGAFGKGFVQGSQGQLNFLPEKHTDFIFTMLAEETGFMGAMALLFLYSVLLLFSLMLMLRSKNRFGSLISAAICAFFFMHIFINISMVMGLVPVVGVPLPFLSYGGSFLLACLMAVGLLINVYLHRDVSAIRISRL